MFRITFLFIILTATLFPAELENLHPLASSWLDRETVLAENLIKEFADQQYAELENKRIRAYSEQTALKR